MGGTRFFYTELVFSSQLYDDMYYIGNLNADWIVLLRYLVIGSGCRWVREELPVLHINLNAY